MEDYYPIQSRRSFGGFFFDPFRNFKCTDKMGSCRRGLRSFFPRKSSALVGCNFVIFSPTQGQRTARFQRIERLFHFAHLSLVIWISNIERLYLSLDQNQRKQNPYPLIPQNKATHHVPRFLRTLFSAKALNFVITVQVSYKIKLLFLLGLLKQKVFFFLHKWVLQENGSKLL